MRKRVPEVEEIDQKVTVSVKNETKINEFGGVRHVRQQLLPENEDL